MGGLYGHAWTSSYSDNSRSPAGVQWATTLAGMSRAQIEAGIDACRREDADFPPSAPRFRAMCLGIPSFVAVKAALRDKGYPVTFVPGDEFLLQVCLNLDLWNYRALDARTAERALRDAYDLAREFVLGGGTLQVIRTALPTPESIPAQPASPETARKHLDEIGAMFSTGGDEDARE